MSALSTPVVAIGVCAESTARRSTAVEDDGLLGVAAVSSLRCGWSADTGHGKVGTKDASSFLCPPTLGRRRREGKREA